MMRHKKHDTPPRERGSLERRDFKKRRGLRRDKDDNKKHVALLTELFGERDDAPQ